MVDKIALIDKIRDCAYRVRVDFSAGYLESVYQNALVVLLKEAGLTAEKEKSLPLYYHGELIGEFRADILVNDSIIIELKAVSSLQAIHEMQLVNYLQVTGMDVGLLINYGGERFNIITKFRTKEQMLEFQSLAAAGRCGYKQN